MYYALVNKYMTFIIIGFFFALTMLVMEQLFYKISVTAQFGGSDSLINFNSIYMFSYIMLVLTLIFYSLNFNNKN